MGLNGDQALYVSAQKEFSKRQSDRQEVDLLIEDTREGYTRASKRALLRELSGKAGLFREIRAP